jgi:hypothetical protein
MPHAVKILFICTFAVYLAPIWLVAQCRTTVDGQVVDEYNLPVSDPEVFVVQDAKSQGTRYFGPFEADSNGSFHASVVISRPGMFFVSAMKEDAGYPSTGLMFYNDQEPQNFELNCDAYRSGIVLKLGPKAVYIQRIAVSDSRTGQQLSSASVTLQRLSSPIERLPRPAFSITTSANLMPQKGKYSGIPVPPNVEISYQISAPGYPTSPWTRLNLRPEQDIEITAKHAPATPLPLTPKR